MKIVYVFVPCHGIREIYFFNILQDKINFMWARNKLAKNIVPYLN